MSGRTATTRLGGFLSQLARSGFAGAVQSLGMATLVGQPVEVVFAALVAALAPRVATLEANAAIHATAATLQALFQQYGVADGDFTKLDAMTADSVRDAVQLGVHEYIYHRWLQELGDRIERRAVSEQHAIRLERDVREYVREAVQLDLGRYDVLALDWNSSDARSMVDRIYEEAYGFLEVGV